MHTMGEKNYTDVDVVESESKYKRQLGSVRGSGKPTAKANIGAVFWKLASDS